MCRFKSGLIIIKENGFDLITDPRYNSHTTLLKLIGYQDDSHLSSSKIVKVELTSDELSYNPMDYNLSLDEDSDHLYDWFDANIEEIERQMFVRLGKEHLNILEPPDYDNVITLNYMQRIICNSGKSIIAPYDKNIILDKGGSSIKLVGNENTVITQGNTNIYIYISMVMGT